MRFDCGVPGSIEPDLTPRDGAFRTRSDDRCREGCVRARRRCGQTVRSPQKSKPKAPIMKAPVSQRPIALLVASLSLAMGLTLGMSLSSGAADLPRKGAERLMQLGAPSPVREASATRPASGSHSNCGSCTTVTTARASETAKGGEVLQAGGKPTTLVSTHGCDGCSTSIGVTGFGKSRTQTVTHGCTKQTLASVSCCK